MLAIIIICSIVVFLLVIFIIIYNRKKKREFSNAIENKNKTNNNLDESAADSFKDFKK